MIEIPGYPPIQQGTTRLVLEAGPCNHDLDYALKAVEAAAQTGAWGFKVQLYHPDRLVQKTTPRYDRTGGPAKTQWEAFAGALDYRDWLKVKAACEANGLVFFASPFDFEAVDTLEDMDVALYKIASGDITHRPLLERVAQTGKPVILSTGAAELPEIRDALQWMQHIDPNLPVCLLVCSLSYPCNPEDAHLNRITTWRNAGQDMVGYSDHTRGVDAPLIAYQLGAVLVEKHFTLEKGKGYDSDFAVDPLEAAEIVDQMGKRQYEPHHMMFGLSQLGILPAELPARQGARRSICVNQDLKAGSKLDESNVTYLRPGTGLSPAYYQQVLGQMVNRDLKAGDQVHRSMLTGTWLSVF